MFLKMTPFFMHNRVFCGVSLWQLCRFEWIWVCLSEELYRIVWAFAGMKPTLRENERWRRDRALFIPTNYWHAETVEIVFRVQSRSLALNLLFCSFQGKWILPFWGFRARFHCYYISDVACWAQWEVCRPLGLVLLSHRDLDWQEATGLTQRLLQKPWQPRVV